jgi:ABC-2 type transport system permease protein
MHKEIWAQATKELRQIRRDRLALALAVGLPAATLLLLGNAISLQVHNLPIVVQNFDSGPRARDLLDVIRSSLTFRVVTASVTDSPETAILANRVHCALVIPEHFDHDLKRGNTPILQLLIDGTDSNTATLIQGELGSAVDDFNSRQVPARLRHAGVRLETRLWFNPGRNSRKFFAPGFFVLTLAIFPAILAVLSVSREGEQKTILQVYVSSISAIEYLAGKVMAEMMVSLVAWTVQVSVMVMAFGLRIVGDPTPFVIASLLFSFCVASSGAWIGAVIPHQAAAVQAIGLLTFVMSLLLSGLIFPISNIPMSLRWISNLVQARYYIEVVRDAFLRGAGWPAAWPSVVAIGLIGSAFFYVAWLKLRRMQVAE